MNLSKLKKVWLKRMHEEGCFYEYEKKKLVDSYVRDVEVLVGCKN